MSRCPLLEDAGLPGLRDCFPGACLMEMFCFVVNKWSVERCLQPSLLQQSRHPRRRPVYTQVVPSLQPLDEGAVIIRVLSRVA